MATVTVTSRQLKNAVALLDKSTLTPPKLKPFPQPHGRPVLGDDAYSGILGEMVRHIEPWSEVDPAGLLFYALSAFSCMFGPDNIITPDGEIEEPVSIYTLLMGDSAYGRKGTAEKSMKRVLEIAEQNFLTHNRSGKLVSSKGLINLVRDNSGKKDRESGELLEDGVEDKRHLAVDEEFVSTMGGMAAGDLGATIRLAFEGRNLTTGSGQPIVSTRPHIVIHGHTTCEEFAARMSSTELAAGTFNRFLPCFTHRSKYVSRTRRPELWVTIMEEIAERLRLLVIHARNVDTPRVIYLDDEAQDVWDEELHADLTTHAKGLSKFVELFTVRRASHVLRVAAVYALLDGNETISLDNLASAMAVVEYSLATVKFIEHEFEFTNKVKTIFDKRVEVVEKALRRAATNGLTRTEVTDVYLQKNCTKPKVDEIFDAIGVIEVKRKQVGAPKGVVICFHPEFVRQG